MSRDFLGVFFTPPFTLVSLIGENGQLLALVRLPLVSYSQSIAGFLLYVIPGACGFHTMKIKRKETKKKPCQRCLLRECGSQLVENKRKQEKERSRSRIIKSRWVGKEEGRMGKRASELLHKKGKNCKQKTIQGTACFR